MTRGTVKWFNAEKGFGFIEPDDGSAEIFVPYWAIQAEGYRTLFENQLVEFDVENTAGGFQAVGVRTL